MIDTCPYDAPNEHTVSQIESFLYFVWEREAIRIAKENGHQPPWTSDDTLAKYRFCNIRRKDDKVSKWLIDNVYARYGGSACAYLAASLCRFINWPPTLQHIMSAGAMPHVYIDLSLDKINEAVLDYGKNHSKVWTGAYVVRGSVNKGVGKSDWIIYDVIGGLAIKHPETIDVMSENSVQLMVEYLSGMYGFGSFMAGQVTADLTYTKWLKNAVDLYTWAPIGPGSTAGLNVIKGVPKTTKIGQSEFNDLLQAANERIKGDLGITDLTLHDVQNCFCEYSKYARTVSKAGRPRSFYKPETAF